MRIYYYFPLQFHYHSAQTIQVIQDYASLAKLGHHIFLFGTYDDEAALKHIQDEIGDLPLHLMVKRGHSKWHRNLLKWRFLWTMACDRSAKVVVSRNYNKTREITQLKPLLGKTRVLMERHEDAVPHLLKKPAEAPKEQQRFAKLLKQVDGLVLTSPAQLPIFNAEFEHLPSTVILPNGVDLARFSVARPTINNGQPPYAVTYVGQFTAWKNVELLFQAVALLDESFQLRIAGGKGDAASDQWIEVMTAKYGLQGRVDYRGFVPRHRLVEDVLQGSSVLLLPLGDNMLSRHFTSPMKLFEYMATHIPVVAVDYPSIRMITGDDSVYLSAPDSESFAKAIRHAVESPDRGQRIAAMQQIACTYSYERRAARFQSYLQQVMA